MFKGISTHVFSTGSRWGVCWGADYHQRQVIIEFETLEQALVYARQEAAMHESEVLIHNCRAYFDCNGVA